MQIDPNKALIGRVLEGRYELVEFIAQGGMGRVFKARQLALDRMVAVKLLLAEGDSDPEFRRRFFLEASLCARLSQPHIIRVFDYGQDPEAGYYIVMEHLQGQSLGQVLAESAPLSPPRAISIAKQICAGLVEAHGQGLVHRDLKPSNLFVTPDDLLGDFVKILDFGVIHQVGETSQMTEPETTLGSPLFMSPEQIEGHPLDGRSDLYSLGIVLYGMLTGTLPFRGESSMQVLFKHMYEAALPVSEVHPDGEISPDLEAVVAKALKKAPDQRFSSAKKMLRALQRCEGEQPGSRPTLTKQDEDATETMNTAQLSGLLRPGMPTETSTLPVQVRRLVRLDLTGFTAFIDLNCPFCYALHARISRWGLSHKINWCLVEHASHALDGPFSLDQEQLLSTEVLEVRHRAPEVALSLPPQRCDSRVANRLLVAVEKHHPDQVHNVRSALYRALWRKGEDIGDARVLRTVLEAHGLSARLLESCGVDTAQNQRWQADWEQADFDQGIPVLTGPGEGQVLIGLPDPQTLVEFLLGKRSRIVDSSVCTYQKRPSLLVVGRLNHLWPLLADVRECCEILQAPSLAVADSQLHMDAVPDLVIAEKEHLAGQEMEKLAQVAQHRSVPWLVATRDHDPTAELQALSLGAKEFLCIDGDCQVARARLGRLLQDRFSLARVESESRTDPLTRLASRKHLLERLEETWALAARTGAETSVILLQLNHWKAFNRAQSYQVGDKVLVQVAELLRQTVRRPEDLIARFGSHEFTVLLPETTRSTARELGGKIQQALAQARIVNHAAEGGRFLTASLGVATLPSNASTTIHHLYDNAARAMEGGD